MARIFIDGFESGNTDLWDSLSGGQTYPPAAGMTGTYGAITSLISGYIEKLLPSNKTELYISFKINYSSNYSGFLPAFKDSNSAVIASFTRNTTSTFLEFRLGNDGATVQATGTIPIVLATTYLIEVRYKPLNTGGILITKINGVQDINFSGDSTAGLENISAVRFGRTSVSTGAYSVIDDIVVDDANWIGNTKIQALAPTGAGATSQHAAVVNAHPAVLSLVNDTVAGPYANFRTIIKSSYITQSGTKIKVGLVTYSSLYNLTVVGCSIGVRDGTTSSFSGAPTRITFGGSNSFTLIASTAINWSDWINFNLTAGVDHLVHLYCSAATVCYGVNNSVAETGYYESNADANDTESITISGYSTQSNVRYSAFGLLVEKTDGSFNYSAVDEIPAFDVDYIKTSSGQIDTYAMGNLAGSIASIKSVAVQSRNWREGNGTYDRGQHIIRPASTDRLAAAKTSIFQISPTGFQSIWELNPEDSAAWEEADVNGMEAGIKAVEA